jgi:4-amino-4-deoxy-L-arabinose transferase-like glycosyltransferase
MRRDAVLLAAFAALLFLTALGARDLWNPNEPIYGEAVREMAQRGEWLVPYVNGMPFGEKPILFYWLARAAGVATFGVNEFSLRLPAALFGIAGTLLVWQLVLPYAGGRRARIAGLLFATTYMVFWGSRSVQMDLFAAVTTIAVILPVTRVWDHGLPAGRGWALAGVAAGIGFLAKGPVTWICPGVALALYAATTGRLRELFRAPVLLGGAVAVAVAAPWYAALALTGHGDVLQEVLIRQNFTRFRNAWDHAEPFWYYLKYFWIDLAPWAWIVPLAAALPGRDANERRLDRLAWCWIAGIVVFFSLSQSKRSPYILPVAGAVAALASGVVVSWLEHRLPARRAVALRVLAAILGALLLGGAVAAIAKVPARYPEVADAARALGAVALLGAIAIALGWTRRERLAVAVLAAVAAFLLAAGAIALPAVDTFKSARPFCAEVATRAPAGFRLVGWRFWNWRAEYAYYLGRPTTIVGEADALRALWEGPDPVVVVVEDANLASLREVLGDAAPIVERGVGDGVAHAFFNGR